MKRDALAGAFRLDRDAHGGAKQSRSYVHVFALRGDKRYFLFISGDGSATLEKYLPHAFYRQGGWAKMPMKMIPYVILSLWPDWEPPEHYRPDVVALMRRIPMRGNGGGVSYQPTRLVTRTPTSW